MRSADPIVRPDSPEAASIQTVTGWVARDGRFWGDDERMARYDGSTVSLCSECGDVCDKSWTKCKPCIAKDELERFAKRERAPWDGQQMLYSEAHDRYFSNPDEAREFAEDEGIEDVMSLRLMLCEPQYLHQVDTDQWEDVLPEDHDHYSLPADVGAALELLNEAIRAAGPVSWMPGHNAWNGEAETGDS